LKHCAVSSLKHIFLLSWQVTLNLNERILKLWKSIRPSGTKVDETNFFTPSGESEGILPKISTQLELCIILLALGLILRMDDHLLVFLIISSISSKGGDFVYATETEYAGPKSFFALSSESRLNSAVYFGPLPSG